jgi:hypothetical protein
MSKIIRDYSTYTVNHNFKISPSDRCVSAASTICKDSDTFKNDCISHFKTLLIIRLPFNVCLSMHCRFHSVHFDCVSIVFSVIS